MRDPYRTFQDAEARPSTNGAAPAITWKLTPAAIWPPVRSNGGGLRHHPGRAKRAPTGRPGRPPDPDMIAIASGTVVPTSFAVRRAVKAIAAGTCWSKPHGKTT